MKKSYWGGLSNVLYFFGFGSLLFEILIFLESDFLFDGPYWLLAAGLVWLLFIFGVSCFILGANLTNFPVPKKKK